MYLFQHVKPINSNSSIAFAAPHRPNLTIHTIKHSSIIKDVDLKYIQIMAEVTSKLSKLNPFGKKTKVDDEDKGEAIQYDSVAAGGQGAAKTQTPITQLRISSALKSFLVHNKALSEAEADPDSQGSTPALQAILENSDIGAPKHLLDKSHPLPEYFVSSSHNTYLIAHQLYGQSSTSAYETALRTGSRCVEIDAWDDDDNKEEPKVTHGYTLVSHISFREICQTIRKVVDEDVAEAQRNPMLSLSPVLISLENHCDAHGQTRLAQIMREEWGDRLLSKDVRKEGHAEQQGGQHVSLAELGGKIAVIVEYHLPNEHKDSDSSSDSSSDDEQDKAAHEVYKAKKQGAPSSIIVPELAELGVYAQSVKPGNNSWFEGTGDLTNGPHHHLINVSESGLATHLPSNGALIAKHNSQHLMRVFPKGTRISSSNLKPVPFWAIGAQICALNWQNFGTSNQLNAALFQGSSGYVLKPAALRAGGDGRLGVRGKKKRLQLHVAGASDIPLHDEKAESDIKPYLSCNIYHPSPSPTSKPTEGGFLEKHKTSPYKQHKLKFLHKSEQNPINTDPVWDEKLEWTYEDSELVFLRMLIKSDDSWAKNPIFATAAVRLDYVLEAGRNGQWTFVRMMDLKGRPSSCTLLVKMEVLDA